MKIAVTGCNGTIGQRVVLRALDTGHAVIGIDIVTKQDTTFRNDPHFTFVRADLTSFDATLEALAGCDAIVQLAAIPLPIDYKVHTHNCNVVISWNVLRAAAELGIDRVVQASSVNVYRGVFSVEPQFEYFPVDERHPTLPDEPYGLSKLNMSCVDRIAEMQADTIVRRYPTMRVASIRLHHAVRTRTDDQPKDYKENKGDLWGYIQRDSGAEAFVKALTVEHDEWKGHEAFLIVAPQIAIDEDWLKLKTIYFPNVPIKEGWVENGGTGFFDCSKAERFLGWVHSDHAQ